MPMTEQGFRKLTYAEILEQQIIRAKDLFGQDIDTSEKSVLGKYIRLNVSDFAKQEEALEAIYLARYIDTATGISLDRLTPFANITRNGPTHAVLSVAVENTGVSNAVVPMNTNLVSSSGALYHTVRQAIFAAYQTGTLLVECNTSGMVGNDTSIIDFYQTQIPNIRILSAEIVSIGQDMETDAQLRLRWKKALAGAGTSTYDSIIGGVLRISGIQDCVIFENDTDKNKDDGSGFTIPPHSFETVVSGGMDSSAEIAQAIFDKKPIGIGTAGAKAYTVQDVAGILHQICFSYAETISIKVVMTIQTGYVLPESYVQDIAKAVVSYFDTNQMGQTIYPVSVCAAVMNTVLAETVTELAFSQSGGLQTPLIISAKQIAVCELQDVYIRKSDGDTYYHVIGDGTLESVADPWEVQS